jgi:hypothetical protein
MTKEIPLTRGKFAIVDDDDYEYLSNHKWYAINSGGYATRSYVEDGKRIFVRMHRLIMNVPEGFIVDHIDGNTLNNQKSNLRICTRAENCRNRGLNKNNTSGYKGVMRNKSKNRWAAVVMYNREKVNCGHYKCKHEAATAYNLKAIELFGEYAWLNEITTELGSDDLSE